MPPLGTIVSRTPFAALGYVVMIWRRSRTRDSRPRSMSAAEAIAPHITAAPRRVLIVLLGAIGDVVRALPLLGRIRRAWPDAHISWAVEPKSEERRVGKECRSRWSA